jgi:ferrochelatase
MTIAIVLFNLGGPSSLNEVEPFLFNLFSDPSILRLPNPFRWLIAKLISKRRVRTAQNIYKEIGGKSPILDNTLAQKRALEESFRERGIDAKVFIAMRYTPPRVLDVLQEIKQGDFEQIILMPLYPQFSTTTTASSFKEWDEHFESFGITARVKKICCYPTGDGFITAQTDLILQKVKSFKNSRILFSAHGLPESIVKSGDPYPLHVEHTAKEIIKHLGKKDLDFIVCYQSRVGPVKWIGPSTESEIERAAHNGKNIILVPLSFVSEHSETLFELDIEYGDLAKKHGIKKYIRIPTVSTHPKFINFLVDICSKMLDYRGIICSGEKTRVCPNTCKSCPYL